MKDDLNFGTPSVDLPAAPLTLEGFAILHQMFRVRRTEWRATQDSARQEIVDEAVQVLDRMTAREDGETALFAGLGHKSDVLAVHFRRTFDELQNGKEWLKNSKSGTTDQSDYVFID